MPTKVTAKAAARIARLKRYRTTLTRGANGFRVTVAHGTRSRPHRVLKVAPAAAAALGKRTAVVAVKSGKLTARVVKPRPKTPNERALELAASQIGVIEAPTNDVKYNTWYYGRRVNGPNFAWCAVFVSWTLSHIGRPFHQAYVPTIVALAHAKQDGLSVIPFQDVAVTLKAGFPVLACYDWPGESPGVADHVEFVKNVIGAASFAAIGGNTARPGGNQSNGGEVCENTRYTADVLCFVKVAA